MTIALRASGTATGATAAVTAVAPAVPAGTTAGDLSVLSVYVKPYTATITTPTSWVKIGEATAGTVATNANDTGSAKILTFVRESAHVGAIPAIVQSGADSMGAVINTYSKDSAKAWDYFTAAYTTGADASSGANYSATGAGGLNVAAGDWVYAATALNGDIGTQTSTAIGGMSGATLGSTVVRQSADVTTSFDTHGEIADIPVDAGSSNAAPTLTYTNSSSTYGVTLWLRLREVAITPVSKENTFMGIASGTAITDAAQTGGDSGDAFDALDIVGTGVGLSVNTSADITTAYDRGLICNLNGQTNANAYVRWNHTALTCDYHRFYFKTHTSLLASSSIRLMRAYQNTTPRWELRWLSTGNLALVEYNSGGYAIQTTGALAVDTVYRVEMKVDIDSDNCLLNVYVGEDTSSPLAAPPITATNNMSGPWDNVRYGALTTSLVTAWQPNLAGIAWSNTGLIGPAVATGTTYPQELVATCTGGFSFLKAAKRTISDPVTSSPTFTKKSGIIRSRSVSAIGSSARKAGITARPTVTATGSAPRQVQKPLALSMAPAPTVGKTAKKSWALASTATSTLRRAAKKTLSTTESITPTLLSGRSFLRTLTAASTPSASLDKVNAKALTMATNVSSAAVQQLAVARTMALSSPLAVTAVKSSTHSLTRGVSATATSLRGVRKTLSDAVTVSRSISRRAGLSRSVTANTTVSTRKAFTKTLLIGSTTTAYVEALKTFLKMLSTSVGTQVQFERRLALVRSLAASVHPSGTLRRGVARTVSVVETGSLSLGKSASRTLTQTVTSTATFTNMRVMLREMVASVTASASIPKEIHKNLIRLLSPSATTVKRTSKTATASVAVLTDLVYGFLRYVTLSALVESSAAVNRLVGKTASVLVHVIPTRKYKKKRPTVSPEETRIRVYPRVTPVMVTTRAQSYLVLGATDPIPVNLPENTIIIRRPAPRWHP